VDSGSDTIGDDLVSIAPTLANPYGDRHSPFVVSKSARACDPNLLASCSTLSPAQTEEAEPHYCPGSTVLPRDDDAGAIHRATRSLQLTPARMKQPAL